MKKKLLTVMIAGTVLSVCLAGCTEAGVAVGTSEGEIDQQQVSEIQTELDSIVGDILTEFNSEAESEDDDQAKADEVAALIDAIYVQERNDNTDEQCAEAKAAWDALTDALRNAPPADGTRRVLELIEEVQKK